MEPFQAYLWPQRVLVLQPGFAAASHRHHAAQIAFGLDGPVAYETPRTGLRRADMLVIPPDTPHAHPSFGAAAVLYLEPESIEWERFPGRGDGTLTAIPLDRSLRAVARSAAGGDEGAAQSLVDRMTGKPLPRSPSHDALVSETCDLIRRGLDGPMTLSGLAKAIHRSPSRLAHRFREATGVPLRRYVLWCRLRAAVEAALRGSSLTEAAHVAGFADSAHLSRTFRAMFGNAPSRFLQRGRMRVTFCESGASA